MAQQLKRDYPDNPAAFAASRAASTRTGLGNSRSSDSEKEDRTTTALNRDLNKASTPPAGDIEFDAKRWRELDKLRKDNVLSKKEKRCWKRWPSR